MIGSRLAVVWLALAATGAVAEQATVVVRDLPGTRAAAATLIVQGIEGGSLPFAAAALVEQATPAEGGDGWRLPIVVELPPPRPGATAGELELYVYALGADGGVAAHRGLALVPPISSAAGVRLITHIVLPSGSYGLRFLVLDPETHRSGLLLRQVEIDQPLALGPARFDDACRAWSVAGGSPGHATSARPVLVRGRPIELSARVSPALDLSAAPTLGARLVPTSAEETESRWVDARVIDRDSRDAWRLELDLPAIGRGVWSLRLEHAGAGVVSPPVEIWVVDLDDLAGPPSEPCARTWAAVLTHAAAAPGASAMPTITGADRDRGAVARSQRARVKVAYGSLLSRLASGGDLDAAAVALCDHEQELAAELPHLPALLRSELEVARRLAGREPEVLAPIMLLHHEAYLEHRRRQGFALAGHSSRVVRALGDLLLEQRERPESRRLASRILTSLAEYGHRNRSFIPSQRLLEAALAVEPENGDALMLLAVNYEWFGRYGDAIPLLERLVALSAGDREAQLRLGVLLGRAGKPAAAEGLLRRILAGDAAPWVLSLAHQALADLLAETERLDEALELLERARTRLPQDQRLYIVSGHLLERAGRAAEARRLFETLPVADAGGSPRLRYGESLTAGLETLRTEIRRAAAVRLPLLARALDGAQDRRGAR